MSEIDRWENDIHRGDAAETLTQLPESSVHCVVTSPPYFGLRDYGVDGQIGLEESLGEYIDALVDIGAEIRRVLREDGSWWLNLGDTFASSPGWGSQSDAVGGHDADVDHSRRGFRRKSKMLVPHRVAIALENTGWVVRADAVWHKPSGMPSSAHDRLNETKEFLFHLTPNPDYWFNLDAIREPHATVSIERSTRADNRHEHSQRQSVANEETLNPGQFVHPNGKNPGDLLEINPAQYPDTHFAVFPEELCETPIKSSCPDRVCADCGTPYVREVEEIDPWDVEDPDREQLRRAIEVYESSDLTEEHLEAVRAYGFADAAAGKQQDRSGLNSDGVQELALEAKAALGGYFREFTTTFKRTLGWVPDCDCETEVTQPGIVLDPFAGTGTACLVAKRFGLRFVGIELNPDYVAMAQRRVGINVDEPERLLEDEETPLTAYTDATGVDRDV
ncbi:DNA-methyltransferase [Natrarchaeobius oligotrophus]|uniref:Type II methyltransferase n=1 Tax=Natrarchaeobius chitinivorans TaxID=1679083 RepID=A0A3N6MI88_NATCH|nr:site-specific DNA-methyltransferase [Natrarchaeobius chitinivorans]RQG93756.1 site-specific DNA-methyltransferase [Natrarchaeobius chitinivorans]